MAEPGKFDSERKAEYLALVRQYPIVKTCAEACGVTKQTIYYHREHDPEFAEVERVALGEGRVRLLKMVKSGEWLLSKSDPETYTDRNKIEHEGGLQIVLSPHPDMMDDEQGGEDE